MFSLELNIQPKNSVDFVTSTEKLDDHLSQYEIFMCSNSGCRDYFEKLTEIIEHIQNKHRKKSPPHYSFSYWIIHATDRSDT